MPRRRGFSPGPLERPSDVVAAHLLRQAGRLSHQSIARPARNRADSSGQDSCDRHSDMTIAHASRELREHAQDTAGALDVFSDLRDQLVRPGECHFSPEPVHQVHLDGFAVQIVVEV